MSLYTRARKHIDMDRVKELKEEKYIAELKKQQEIVIAEIFKLAVELPTFPALLNTIFGRGI